MNIICKILRNNITLRSISIARSDKLNCAYNCLSSQVVGTRFLACNAGNHQKSTAIGGAEKTHRKTKEPIKITLIAQNQSMSVTSLEEAHKLAKRRELRLIKVQELDSKTQRPVYKLVSPAELISEELKELKTTTGDKDKNKIKSEKSLTIASRISDNDLNTRLKNITKWLSKHHEVRVLIQGTSPSDAENCQRIFKTIEQHIQQPEIIGKIVQNRKKGSVIKFSILPIIPEENSTISAAAAASTNTTTTNDDVAHTKKA